MLGNLLRFFRETLADYTRYGEENVRLSARPAYSVCLTGAIAAHRDGDRLTQGFAPSEYRSKAGVTTVINVIGSLDHARLYASNANLSFGVLWGQSLFRGLTGGLTGTVPVQGIAISRNLEEI